MRTSVVLIIPEEKFLKVYNDNKPKWYNSFLKLRKIRKILKISKKEYQFLYNLYV